MARSVMNHQFSRVPSVSIPRSRFNRSHGYKTTFDSGYLVPFFVDEALPGDTFDLRASLLARLSTPIVPIMDNLRLETFFFAVPIRLVWDNFTKMMGEQIDPGDSTDYLVPQVKSGDGFAVGSIHDYFGLPTGVPNIEVSVLWHRAYNLVWNEWFRDENLQDSVEVPRTDGPDSKSLYQLLRRGKRHDYFTSCLPWPQKGPGVELPLTGNAPVSGGFEHPQNVGRFLEPQVRFPYASESYGEMQHPARWYFADDEPPAGEIGTYESLSWVGSADMSQVGGATINSLREAFQLQRLLERDARGGSRYTELVRSHFGVISPDARLQRPEYLGGSSSRVNITPVQQTSATDGTTPQGNLAAFGLSADSFHGFSKSFTEHTLILGLINVRADLTYQQGIPRMFSRRTRWDFYWPALAHLGEQPVYNKEIYADGTSEDDEVFGYQERWAEYRYYPSKITGKFRSTYDQSLDVWHLSQKFENRPVLNDEFIEENPPLQRALAVQTEPQFILDVYFDLKCARPMPVYSVPGLIDHF
jgi:hypothetical protein